MAQGATSGSSRADLEARWRELMVAAQAGDQSAYSELLKSLLGPLRRYVQRRWGGSQEIEDVVQDILLSVHVVRHTYDPARPFAPWIMTIAHRRVMDMARKSYGRGHNETTLDEIPETFLADDAKTGQSVSDDADEVRHALSKLGAQQREAVELIKLQGLSLEEASRVTGKSTTALKVAVHRALKDMRRAVERKS